MRRRDLLPFAGGLWLGWAVLGATTALATVGGPRELEALGYMPSEQAVYFLEHDHSEALAPPELYRLSVRRGDGWRRPVRTAWRPSDDAYGQHVHDPALKALRARMRPLVALPASELRVAARAGKAGRMQVELDGPHVGRRSVALRAVGEPAAEVVRLYVVPGRRDAIAVLRYRGVLVESGYDRDRPILLSYRPPARAESGEVGFEAVETSGGYTRLRVAASALERRRMVELAAMEGRCRFEDDEVRCQPHSERYTITSAPGWTSVFRRRDGIEVARLHVRIDGPSTYDAVREAAGRDWSALCRRDRDCLVVANDAIVLRAPGLAAEDLQECVREGRWLACVQTRTARRELVGGWFIDLASGRVHEMETVSPIGGSRVTLRASPRWSRAPRAPDAPLRLRLRLVGRTVEIAPPSAP